MGADRNESPARSEAFRTALTEHFRNRPDTETGLDRLKEMYTITNWQISPELALNFLVLRMGFGFGFITGFQRRWNDSKEEFIRLNKESKFLNRNEYFREALMFRYKFCGRQAFKLGARLGFITTLFSLCTSTLAMYNNQLTAKEYAAGGLLGGALWQGKVGLGGIVVGGAVGGLLSGLGGYAAGKVMEHYGHDFAHLRYELHCIELEKQRQYTKYETERKLEELLEEARKEVEEEKQAR